MSARTKQLTSQLAIGHDVTFGIAPERESERKILDTRPNQFERMESVGRLAGGVVHDFRDVVAVYLESRNCLGSSWEHKPVTIRRLGKHANVN